MAAQTMGLGDVSQTVPGGLTGLAGWDLTDHSSLAPIDLGVSILFLVLIPIFLGLRLSVRIFVVRKVGWDDSKPLLSPQTAWEDTDRWTFSTLDRSSRVRPPLLRINYIWYYSRSIEHFESGS